jgi:CRISPR/Cas system-associated exonuclease Cas4 (RecB family)
VTDPLLSPVHLLAFPLSLVSCHVVGATLQLQHSFQRWKNKVFHYILKLNKSLLQQQDLSTHDFIEYKKALEQKNKDHSLELKKYQELNQELEKKIAILSKTPPPAPPVVIEVKKKRKTQGDGLSEVQLMADALLRIQESMRGVVETDEEIMDELADELLERVQIRDDGEEDEEPEEEEEF